MQEFIDDDAGYLAWIRANQTGFVMNTYREGSTTYNMLHGANCPDISSPKIKNYTSKGYKKVCSLKRQELITYANQTGSYQICQHCNGSSEIEYPIDD